MKLVSRLRGLSSNSSSSNGSGSAMGNVTSGSSSSVTSTLSHSIHPNEKHQRRNTLVINNAGVGKSRRGSAGNPSPNGSDHESAEELTPEPRIVRDRSRSVCMPVLTSSQLRHLHRRASHHVYVFFLLLIFIV